jgi:hypothetical protein
MGKWEFAYNFWTERNKIKHDILDQPEERKKEKKFEIIVGEHKKPKNKILHAEEGLELQMQQQLPIENLKVIQSSIINC